MVSDFITNRLPLWGKSKKHKTITNQKSAHRDYIEFRFCFISLLFVLVYNNEYLKVFVFLPL